MIEDKLYVIDELSFDDAHFHNRHIIIGSTIKIINEYNNSIHCAIVKSMDESTVYGEYYFLKSIKIHQYFSNPIDELFFKLGYR